MTGRWIWALSLLSFMTTIHQAISIYTNGLTSDQSYIQQGAKEPAVVYVEIWDPTGRVKPSGFTATLVAPDILLTTAHTIAKYIDKRNPGTVKAIHGAAYTDARVRIGISVPHPLDSAIIHKDYPSSTDRDVAFIRLKKPIPNIPHASFYRVDTVHQGLKNKSKLNRFLGVSYGYGRTVTGPSDGIRRGAVFPSIVPMAGRHLMVGFYPSPPNDGDMTSIIDNSGGQFQLNQLPILRRKAQEFQGFQYGLLAPGDSGGPLFTTIDGKATIVGLNKNATCHPSVPLKDQRHRPIFYGPQSSKSFYFLCQSGFSYIFDPQTGQTDPEILKMFQAIGRRH